MAGTFGTINNPLPSTSYGDIATGLPLFISNVLKVIFVGAGLFAFFNLIVAGFTYLTASNDKGKLQQALASINMSLVGLIVMVSAGVLTGIASYLLFGDASFILKPQITGPGSY